MSSHDVSHAEFMERHQRKFMKSIWDYVYSFREAPCPICDSDTDSPPKKKVVVDMDAPMWTEAEAAAYMGYNVDVLARLRRDDDSEIPADLYRQRTPGGKVMYFAKKFRAWHDNCFDK
jgi:hypothetical protein